MSHIPVFAIIISDGAVIGALIIHFHIDVISMCLNSSFPARLDVVWRATSNFAVILLRWVSRLPLLFIVIPRYL